MTSANLSGRSEGYRGVAIRCPGCAEPMRQVSLAKADAEVDVCDSCGGLWVDWFDGEVRAIATETLRVSEPLIETSSGDAKEKDAPKRPSRNEAIAIGACPRCTQQLITERYAITAEVSSARVEGRTSVVAGKTGAELLRCEECMGSFVTRPNAELLSWLSDASDDAPASKADVSLKPLPWERFIAVIKGILGMKETKKK
jgi:Zn-finger nucleic acid-binding protein